MKHTGLLFLSFFMLLASCSEEADPVLLTFRITSLPGDTPVEDRIFLAGNFNDWDAAHPEYALEKNNEGDWEISFEAPHGTLEYKFTRGSWEKVETDPQGGEINNRKLTYQGGGGLLELQVLGWKDLDTPPGTAAENVYILNEAFAMPQLDRTRRIWIYLPPDYDESKRSYPVLYMHDGQNLFDDRTSFVGEWGIDESLNTLFEQGDSGLIVVGIDHGGFHRLDEYTPWVNEEYGGGEGAAYAQFLVESLKPHIDANYRTLPEREHTGIMGSSLGGLISLYASIEYQEVFSRSGIFSPSLWFSEDAFTHVSTTGKREDMRFFIMGGELEGEGLIPAMESLVETMKEAGFSDEEIKMQVDSHGEHTESYWRREFPDAYLWLYADPL